MPGCGPYPQERLKARNCQRNKTKRRPATLLIRLANGAANQSIRVGSPGTGEPSHE